MTELTEPATVQSGLDQRTIDAVLHGRLMDPFALFGPHRAGDGVIIRSFQPGALAVDVVEGNDSGGRLRESLYNVNQTGLFVSGAPLPDGDYQLRITWPTASGGELVQYTEDPYRFGLLLGELDLHLLREGTHRELGRCLGANPMRIDGVAGTRFAVWAPNARRVSVVGDFNNGTAGVIRCGCASEAGIWELFIPRLNSGARYKYEFRRQHGNMLPLRPTLWRRATEVPPSTASVVADPTTYQWNDAGLDGSRAARHEIAAPISIYEVHAGSWPREPDDANRSLTWHELGDRADPLCRTWASRTSNSCRSASIRSAGPGATSRSAYSRPPPLRLAGKTSCYFVDRCHRQGSA